MRRFSSTLMGLGSLLAVNAALAAPYVGPMTCAMQIADAKSDYQYLKNENVPELKALVPTNETRAQAYAKYLNAVSGPQLKKLYFEAEKLAAKYFPGVKPESAWRDLLASKEGKDLVKRYHAAVREPSLKFIKLHYPKMICDVQNAGLFGDSTCHSPDWKESVSFGVISPQESPSACGELNCVTFTESKMIAPAGWGEKKAVGAGASVGLESGRTYELQTVREFTYPQINTSRREPVFKAKTIRFVESQAKGKRFYQANDSGLSFQVPMQDLDYERNVTNREAYETFVWERLSRRAPECLEETDEALHGKARVSGPGYQPAF